MAYDIDDESSSSRPMDDAAYAAHVGFKQRGKQKGVGMFRLFLLSFIMMAFVWKVGMMAQKGFTDYMSYLAWEGAGQSRPGSHADKSKDPSGSIQMQ